MRNDLVALSVLFLCVAGPLFGDGTNRKTVIVALHPPREIVGVSGAALDARKDAIHELQQRVLDRVDPDEFDLLARWVTLPGFAARVTDAEWRHLEQHPDVLRVDEDPRFELTLAQSVPLIGGDTVRAAGFTGSGITVAVIDSGVMRTHNELQGAVVAEACFCTSESGTGCCPNGTGTQTGTDSARDDHGHGTHVAGIIAARGVSTSPGVAPAASIVAVKVLDANNRTGDLYQVINALDWTIAERPDIDVVNMSLGSLERFSGACDHARSWTIDFATAINSLVSRGTVVVVSSGNNQENNAMTAPACIQNALAVGATYDAALGSVTWQGICTDPTTAADRIVCFSNASTALDLLAPGAVIDSLSNTGGTRRDSGTSMAAPHVAGAAAVLMDISSSLTPAQLESALESTGVPILDTRNNTTYPRIDLEAAAASVNNGGGTTDVVANGGFEQATATGNSAPGWTVMPAPGNTLIWRGSHPNSGSVYAYFGNSLNTHDAVKQNVTIPADATSAQLTFWLNVTSEEATTTTAFDTFEAWFATTGGAFTRTLARYSNLDKTRSSNADGVYFQVGPIDVLAQKGTTQQLIFSAMMDES